MQVVWIGTGNVFFKRKTKQKNDKTSKEMRTSKKHEKQNKRNIYEKKYHEKRK